MNEEKDIRGGYKCMWVAKPDKTKKWADIMYLF